MSIGSVSISIECINFIKSILPIGSTILELGSGQGTVELSKWFKMYSVENQFEWVHKFPDCTTYIPCRTLTYDDTFTAPNIAGTQTAWYHPDDLFENLPKSYDLILIDGPGGHFGRGGFFKYLEKFNTNVPILFDDINREADLDLMIKVSQQLNKPYTILESDKSLGYII
jgi:hypothetical protein